MQVHLATLMLLELVQVTGIEYSYVTVFNGTPDLRGRVLVGTTSGMGGAGLSFSAVKPGVAGNPGPITLNESQGIEFK